MVMLRAEDKPCTEGLVQAKPERAREARVAVRDEHVRQPHVAERRGHEVLYRGFCSGCLERGDHPQPPSEKVDVHLQKVVAGASYRKFNEVEADAAAAARRHGEQACGWQMEGFDALADGAGLDVLLDSGRQARPPNRAGR